MSYYERDQDPLLRAYGYGEGAGTFAQRAALFLAPDDFAPMAWPIACSGCPARTSYTGFGPAKVWGQIELWHQGWRRHPDTGRDYCPRCAPTAVGL